jgi:hypothetical protein
MTTHTLVSTAQLAEIQRWLDAYQDQHKIMLDPHVPDTARLQATATAWRCLDEALAAFVIAAPWAPTEQGAE